MAVLLDSGAGTQGYALLPQIVPTQRHCEYFESLARKAALLGDLNAPQATMFADMCAEAATRRHWLHADNSELLKELRASSELRKCVAGSELLNENCAWRSESWSPLRTRDVDCACLIVAESCSGSSSRTLRCTSYCCVDVDVNGDWLL